MPDVKDWESGKKKLTREQKVGFTLLLVFAVFAIGLGIMQIRNTMYAPFSLGSGIPSEIAAEINSPETLAYRDTDNDGLSDFDELYVYQTSPYLADTDSDGISDFQEVKNGTNPLCPEGKDCSLPVPVDNPDFSASSSIPSSASLEEQRLKSNAEIQKQVQDLPNQLRAQFSDPVELRKILANSGLSDDQIKSVTDEQLLQIADSALKSQGIVAMASSTPLMFGSNPVNPVLGGYTNTLPSVNSMVAASGPVTLQIPAGLNLPAELIKKLSDPAQARPLLIQQGADAETVGRLSDDEVMTLVNQTLNAAAATANSASGQKQ